MNDHWRLTQALTALHSARRTLLETDPDLRLDEVELSAALGSEQATVEDAIRSTIAAAIIADCNAAQADERAMARGWSVGLLWHLCRSGYVYDVEVTQ